jgi:nuclear pore complex protein Nup53
VCVFDFIVCMLCRDPLSTPKDKSGAPPVEGLYDQSGPAMRESTPYDQPAQPGSHTPFTAMPSTIRAGHLSHSFACQGQSPPSPAQLDPFYLHGESITSDDHYDDCWVTVFGYVPLYC